MRYSDLTLYRRLLQLCRPYWVHILLLFLLSLAAVPIGLLGPVPLKIAVDSVIGSQPLPDLAQRWLPPALAQSSTIRLLLAALLLVGVALAGQLLELVSLLLRTVTAEKLVLRFRARLFHHVQRMSLSYHDTKGTADSIYRIQYDAPAIQYIAIDGVIPFIAAGLTLVGMIWVIIRMDWQLALVALAVSPVLFGVARASRSRLREGWAESKSIQSTALSVVQEVLGAVRIVKAFGREDHEENRFLHHSNESLRALVRLTLIESGSNMLVGLIIAVGTATVLFVGTVHVEAGILTLGELLVVMTYLAQLYEPLKTIGRKVASVQAHLAGAERAFALLDEASEVAEKPNARALARAVGTIDFRNVSFAYRTGSAALRDISFRVEPGTRVGIVGSTGAGKTTLVSLLMRLYDPEAGQILLDGNDLREYKLADLRDQFAVVLQESVLFSASIAENIAYARLEASEAEIRQAAEAACADEFILALPDGYKTQVGERGMRLSGGERQRIALARAFLKNAPLLIMDEPTSAIDMRTERAIFEAMERLVRGRTTFLITHRPNPLAVCDQVISIENGALTHTWPARRAV